MSRRRAAWKRSIFAVTSREAVEAAAREYDQLGAAKFLKRYGFRPARRYRLRLNGSEYPSKAIVAVAFKYQFPGKGPLENAFGGGVLTVVKVLKRMGFGLTNLRAVSGNARATADPRELERRTGNLLRQMKRTPTAPPVGNVAPKSQKQTVIAFVRDPAVQAYVRDRADGVCELCHERGFARKDGEPYLEIHHVEPLTDGGPDTPGNTVAICANCHRELHSGRRSVVLKKRLYRQVRELVPAGHRAPGP